MAQVRFTDAKAKLDVTQPVTALTPITDAPVAVDWSTAVDSDFGPNDLEREAAEGAAFDALAAPASKAKSYDTWTKGFATWVYGAKKLNVLRSADPPLVSQPGETEGQFRVRLQQSARESRDRAVDEIRQKYPAEDRGAAGAAAQGPGGAGPRGEPGVGGEAADGDLVRRDAARRGDGAQGREHVHRRARHDGRAGRGTVDEGSRGREARR